MGSLPLGSGEKQKSSRQQPEIIRIQRAFLILPYLGIQQESAQNATYCNLGTYISQIAPSTLYITSYAKFEPIHPSIHHTYKAQVGVDKDNNILFCLENKRKKEIQFVCKPLPPRNQNPIIACTHASTLDKTRSCPPRIFTTSQFSLPRASVAS